jgi:hypothetical protein
VSALFFVLASNATARWRWPVEGRVLTTFRYGPDPFAGGQRRGITIAAASGTPVRSACDGTVRFRGSAGTAGRTVTVVCGSWTATYLHLTTITAGRGQRLRAGSRLGTVGRTGRPRLRTTHLAFGIRRTGRRWGYVDPLSLLPGADREPPVTIGRAPKGRPPAIRPPPPVESWRPITDGRRPIAEGRRPITTGRRPIVVVRRPTLALLPPRPFVPGARPREPLKGPGGAVPLIAWGGLGAVVAALVVWPAQAVRRRRQLRVAVKGVPPLSQ